ncbi:MAG: 30S ribosome-binding factor RbfA [Armatimonadota bacterium]
MTQRQERVEELLKVEISEILQREMQDPRLGFVTITDVEITPDLRHARVFVSIMGDDEKKKTGMKALKSAAGFIRGELGKRVRMRVTPELEFKVDESIDRGVRIFELLEQLKKDEPKQE